MRLGFRPKEDSMRIYRKSWLKPNSNNESISGKWLPQFNELGKFMSLHYFMNLENMEAYD